MTVYKKMGVISQFPVIRRWSGAANRQVRKKRHVDRDVSSRTTCSSIRRRWTAFFYREESADMSPCERPFGRRTIVPNNIALAGSEPARLFRDVHPAPCHENEELKSMLLFIDDDEVHEMMSIVGVDTPLLPIMQIEMTSKRTIASPRFVGPSRAEAKTSRSRGESSPAQPRLRVLVHKQMSLA